MINNTSHIKTINPVDFAKECSMTLRQPQISKETIDFRIIDLAEKCLKTFKDFPERSTLNRSGVLRAIEETIDSELDRIVAQEKVKVKRCNDEDFPEEVTLEQFACRRHRDIINRPLVCYLNVLKSFVELNALQKANGRREIPFKEVVEKLYFPIQAQQKAEIFFGKSFAILMHCHALSNNPALASTLQISYIDFPLDEESLDFKLSKAQKSEFKKYYEIYRKNNLKEISDKFSKEFEDFRGITPAILTDVLYEADTSPTDTEISTLIIKTFKDLPRIKESIHQAKVTAKSELSKTRELIAEHFSRKLIEEEGQSKSVEPVKKGKKSKKNRTHPKHPVDTGVKKAPELSRINPGKQEEEVALHETIASLLTFEETKKLIVLSRVTRWATDDPETIRNFSDWDGQKEVLRYKDMDSGSLRYQRACHHLPGITQFLTDKALEEQYTFPTERGYGLLAMLHQDGKSHPGVVYLGIEERRLFHCYMTPLKQNARTIQEYFQEASNQVAMAPGEIAHESTVQYEVKVAEDCTVTFIYPDEDYSLSVMPLK